MGLNRLTHRAISISMSWKKTMVPLVRGLAAPPIASHFPFRGLLVFC